MAMRLADRGAWPRSRSAITTALVFAVHAVLRGGLTAGAAATTGIGAALFALELAVLASLVMAAQIDLAARIVPNQLVLAMLAAGLVRMALEPSGPRSQLLGLLVVGGVMLVVGLAGRGALGAGDVKLLASAGLYLGWRAGLVAFLASFIYAAAISLALICLRLRRRRDMVPFAPFLSAGIWTAMVLGGDALALVWPFLAP
ncbi:MAG: prepilin peptidase [Bacillota bacterium]|nr:prepilin peptidase [Bacillota bacterium]